MIKSDNKRKLVTNKVITSLRLRGLEERQPSARFRALQIATAELQFPPKNKKIMNVIQLPSLELKTIVYHIISHTKI